MIPCPNCHSTNIKKNGQTYYGKQNHKCKDCFRQFVLNNNHTVPPILKEIAKRALLERMSLRGICRLIGVSLTWMMQFAKLNWLETPKDLGVDFKRIRKNKKLQFIGLQLDEMWSFVQKKSNKAWIWVCYEPDSQQVICIHIGSRALESMEKIWVKIPKKFRKKCFFETDDWKAFQKVIPSEQHWIGKKYTHFIEGLFTKVRSRVSRLVRKSLSFSKKAENHELAIKYFFWNMNLENQAALH